MTIDELKALTNLDVVLFWPYDTAPEYLQELSPHGGDEDWIVICSPKMEHDSLIYRECGGWTSEEYKNDEGKWYVVQKWEANTQESTIGSCSVSRHEYEGLIIFIGAHA